MERLTDSQQKLYDKIIDYIDEYGFSPSFRELTKLTGKTSVSSTFHQLNILKRKGYIDYSPRLSRTIRVLK